MLAMADWMLRKCSLRATRTCRRRTGDRFTYAWARLSSFSSLACSFCSACTHSGERACAWYRQDPFGQNCRNVRLVAATQWRQCILATTLRATTNTQLDANTCLAESTPTRTAAGHSRRGGKKCSETTKVMWDDCTLKSKLRTNKKNNQLRVGRVNCIPLVLRSKD